MFSVPPPKMIQGEILPQGVSLLDLKHHGDERGGLVVGESGSSIPFQIARVYTIFHTKENVVRGCHAHRHMQQMLVNVTGSFDLLLDDGSTKVILKFTHPGQGIVITGYVWRELKEFSSDSVINCFSDKLYKDCIYIKSYEEFIDQLGV